MAVIQTLDQIAKNGKFREGLIHVRCADNLPNPNPPKISTYTHVVCVWMKNTFFFRSTLLSDNAPATTVSATKSLYGRSSEAVKVERASMKRTPPRANCLVEMRCRP
jgi:hypothetical protein